MRHDPAYASPIEHAVDRPSLPPRRGALEWVFVGAWRLLRAYLAHRREKREYDKLLAMPDHMLRDVGVTRGDVYRMRSKRFTIADSLEEPR